MINFSQQFDALKNWALSAKKSGWITQAQFDELEKIEQQTADDLFQHGNQRPLVVALFGGTGAGKSSLINRLAGEEIAKTGVERPTSHEITLFLHQAYQLTALPTDLPTEKINVRYHNDDRRKLIAWLDMPDIDSTETTNRQLVETWLPYIDWLVYVVTPERYQDDIGWRFLQQRSQRHHWLFVMNHWDEGSQKQIEDFRNRLILENISTPTVLRTSCTESKIDDDFEQLEQTIQDALQQHGLAVLKEIGAQARLDDLEQLTQQYKTILGTDSQWQAVKENWQQLSEAGLKSIQSALSTQADFAIQMLPIKGTSGFKLWRKKTVAAQLPPPDSISSQLWSPRVETLANDLIRRLETNLHSEKLPATPFTQQLSAWQKNISTPLRNILTVALTKSMAKPGSLIQRFFWKTMRWLSRLLPLAAAVWVATHVIQRFYAGTQGLQEFLGTDFAVHSLLMIGLGWFVPWIIQRQLQPSITDAVRRGLKMGIQDYLEQLKSDLEQIFATTIDTNNTMCIQLESTKPKITI